MNRPASQPIASHAGRQQRPAAPGGRRLAFLETALPGSASTSVTVLYRASTSRLLSLYRTLQREHPGVDFVREGSFRRDLLQLMRRHEYLLFVVDDTVFIEDFKMSDIAGALSRHADVLGFPCGWGAIPGIVMP